MELIAWILEKWRSWANAGGDLDGRFSRDSLLTTLTIYRGRARYSTASASHSRSKSSRERR